MENVIYLVSAFDVHARLCEPSANLPATCRRSGRMSPSKSRHLQQLARKIGISQLRGMVEAAEQLLAA
jgi:phage I-like protein